MKKLWTLVPLLCACCVSPLETATGKAEVTITAPRRQVKDALVSAMVDRGYTVANDSAYSMTFEKDADATLTVLLGSQYDGRVVQRVRFTLVERKGSTRVVTDIHGVTNPGSPFEKISDLSTSSNLAHQAQAFLEKLRAGSGSAGAREAP